MSTPTRQIVLSQAEAQKAINLAYRPAQMFSATANSLCDEGLMSRLQTQSGFVINERGIRELARMRIK